MNTEAELVINFTTTNLTYGLDFLGTPARCAVATLQGSLFARPATRSGALRHPCASLVRGAKSYP